jgi:hypothetical protein
MKNYRYDDPISPLNGKPHVVDWDTCTWRGAMHSFQGLVLQLGVISKSAIILRSTTDPLHDQSSRKRASDLEIGDAVWSWWKWLGPRRTGGLLSWQRWIFGFCNKVTEEANNCGCTRIFLSYAISSDNLQTVLLSSAFKPHLFIYLWLYSPFVGPWPLYQFLNPIHSR